MAGSIADNAALYKKTFKYVPPTPPAQLIESTIVTLDFIARKFIHIGIDPSEAFETVVHIVTSSRHIKLTTAFLRRIFALMGNILSFILDMPVTYKRTIFLETVFYKISNMVYSGANALVIESKTQPECRILLNRADLLHLNKLEWCIDQIIKQKLSIQPIIHKLIEEYCEYLDETGLDAVRMPENLQETESFITSVSPIQRTTTPHLAYQIQMFAATQLAEIWKDRRKGQNSQKSHDLKMLSPMSPSYSPKTEDQDGSRSSGTNNLAEATADSQDQVDGSWEPEDIHTPHSFDVNDGPEFFNGFHTPPTSSRPTYTEHPAPLRITKRRLF